MLSKWSNSLNPRGYMKKFMIALLLVGSIVSTDLAAMRRKRCSMRGAFKAVFVAALLLLSGNAAAAAPKKAVDVQDHFGFGAQANLFGTPSSFLDVDFFADPRLMQAPQRFRDACAQRSETENNFHASGDRDVWTCGTEVFEVAENTAEVEQILAVAPENVREECAKRGAIRTVLSKEVPDEGIIKKKLTCKTVAMTPVKTVTPGRWFWSSDVETITHVKKTTEKSCSVTVEMPKAKGWFSRWF